MKFSLAVMKPALRPLRGDFSVYAVASLMTTILTWFVYNVRDLTWRVPISYADRGDSMFYMGNIQTDLDTGWYEHQPRLGAPFGQTLHDFKTADNLPHVFINAFGLFVDDFGTAMNGYFLLGFPLAAVTAVWFLRLVGVSRSLSAVLAILFALAPYHFIRNQNHMWLGEYWAIPLGLGIVVMIATGRRIWGRRQGQGRVLGWLTGPTVGTLLALALVVSSNSYYGLWTLELIAVTGLVRFVATREVRAFVAAIAAGVWTVLVAVANMLPDVLYAQANGANSAAVQRLPTETEIYAIKLAQLVLPVNYHRIGPLRALRQYYDSAFLLPSEGPVLGAVGAAGLLIALTVVVHALVAQPFRSSRYSMLYALAGLSFVTLLIGMVGGVSTFLGFITSDLRGANRISIFIALLSLAILGLTLDTVVRRATRRLARPAAMVLASVVASLLLALGYYDQVPSRHGSYDSARQLFEQDERMIASVEDAVEPGAMILQLPYIPFPENPDINGVSYSDQIMPYLQSKTLKWSGGAVKGRPSAEWVRLGTASLGWTGLVSTATLAGFDGVLLDKQAFTERSAVPTAELTALLGSPVVKDRRYVFFSTSALRRSMAPVSDRDRTEVVDRVLRPTLARWEPNFLDGFNYPDSLKEYDPRIELDNARRTATTVDLSFEISYREGDRVLRFYLPDGTNKDIAVKSLGSRQSIRLQAPPGRSTIRVEVVKGAQPANTSGADSGPIQVSDIRTSDSRLVDLSRAILPESGRPD